MSTARPAIGQVLVIDYLPQQFLNEKRRTREIPWEDCEVATEPDIETGSPGMLEMEVTPQDVLNAVRTLDEHHRVVVTMFTWSVDRIKTSRTNWESSWGRS